MTLHNPSNPSNAFVRFMRKVYHPIGFKKGYNFILWFIFAGAMTGFVLARLQYLSINNIFKHGAGPGEWYYYSQKLYHFGITLHLSTILPAGLLAVLQFTPFIRYKALIFHRINGYVVILLLLLGNVGALMIARHAFGGTLATQLLIGVLAIATTTSATLSYYNIKMLQIDQHRAWMLRCWFYAGSIITLRIIFILTALIISSLDSFNMAISCDQIAFSSGAEAAAAYPGCNVTADGVWTGYTAVHASFGKSLIETAAAFQLSFGMAGWLAFLLHAVGVELYLNLTPAESERLRRVSYERQLERGFSHPGSAGLTVDRLGDAEKWMPPATKGDAKVLTDNEAE